MKFIGDDGTIYSTYEEAKEADRQYAINALLRPQLQDTIVLPSGTIAPGWKLLQSLLIVIIPEDNGGYLVYDRFNVYGYGVTQEEAQQDYITALTEYYQILADKEDSPTQALFQRLQSYLQRDSEAK